MIKYLRLFNIDPSGELVIITPGKTFYNIDDQLSDFFLVHSKNVLEDRNTQNFRFKNKDVEFLNYIEPSFRDEESFTLSSHRIANKMKDSLSTNAKNNFYLVVFSYSEIDNERTEYLCILKMDSMEGMHVNDEMTLKYLSQMLPDKKSRLQKAAVIYKKNVEKYVQNLEPENEERTHYHLKVLDRQDADISGLFSHNFLDSLVVTDTPETIGKIAVNSIVTKSKEYINKNGAYGINDLKQLLKNELSVEKNTSFDSLVDIVYNTYDMAKIGGKTSEDIATEAYNLALEENPTVVRSFRGRFRKPPKVQLVDADNEDKIKISYLESLELSKQVTLDSKTDNDFHILRIKKSIVVIK